VEQRLIAGAFGILGHGNVAGVGQALLQNEVDPAAGEEHLKYYLARNEQAMVARGSVLRPDQEPAAGLRVHVLHRPGVDQHDHRCRAGHDRPGARAAPASDIFATRFPDPVLQQLEDPRSLDISVNDAFKPVSRFWDGSTDPSS